MEEWQSHLISYMLPPLLLLKEWVSQQTAAAILCNKFRASWWIKNAPEVLRCAARKTSG